MPNAIERLVGAKKDLPVAQCGGCVGGFAEIVGGDGGELVGGLHDATDACVVHEVEQAGGAHDAGVAAAELFIPDDVAGLRVEGVGEAAVVGDEEPVALDDG